MPTNNNQNWSKSKSKISHLIPEEISFTRRKISNELYESNQYCSSASNELQQYYETGDTSELDLDDDPIDCPEKDKGYIRTLLDIINKIIHKEIKDEKEEEGEVGIEEETSENEDELNENKKKYFKHIWPILMFLIISPICIIAWIAFWTFFCCERCWCSCFKKKSLFLPFYIVNFFFFAAIISICIYGFTQLNKIFKGFADVKCSYLSFFETVLYGEKKEAKQKWTASPQVCSEDIQCKYG